MSKQKKSSGVGRAPEHESISTGEWDKIDPAVLEQGSLGNQALQAKLAGDQGPEVVGLDVVRDAAFPLLERGILALQYLPRDSSQVGRFVEILDRSHLPEERKQILVDRLTSNQSSAERVGDAVREWFQSDDEVLRSSLVGLMEQVWGGLQRGAGDVESASWDLGDDEVAELSPGSLEGRVTARAESLIADLSNHAASDELDGQVADRSVGEAVTGFCRSIILAIAFDEEEEEEEGFGPVEVGEEV